MRSKFELLVLFCISITRAQRKFIWRPSNSLSNSATYEYNRAPCVDDLLLTEQNVSTVLFMDKRIEVNSFYLPDNGVVYFGSHTAYGLPGNWQCEKEYASVDSRVWNHEPANFHDSANWQIYDYRGELYTRPNLDFEAIPGELDTVVFPNDGASQVKMEHQAIMKALRLGDRSLNSHDIYEHLVTFEGQQMFKLDDSLMAIIEVDGHKYKWPHGRVFAITNLTAPIGGQIPWNTKPTFFEAVCAYIKCDEKLEDFCENPILPIGSCCTICGAMATFHFQRSVLISFMRLSILFYEDMLDESIGISIMRLDSDNPQPSYQLTVIPREPQIFDEEFFTTVLNGAIDHINVIAQLSVEGNVDEVKMWNLEKKISVERKIHFVLYVVFRVEYNRNQRLRRWIAKRRQNAPTIPVVFRRGIEAIELRRNREQSRNVNEIANFDPPTFEAEFSNEAFGKEQNFGSHLSFSSLVSQSTANDKTERSEDTRE
ncbi:Protein amnionless [Aphelenchoides besseyi]|nr:Protein amnionless [Aphelenchoides besseyi]KAI6198955.1 Protein amnionless [Aphelenchoides besseyi]